MPPYVRHCVAAMALQALVIGNPSGALAAWEPTSSPLLSESLLDGMESSDLIGVMADQPHDAYLTYYIASLPLHPEIQALSDALHGDLDLIYWFVKNYVEFEPTWGLRKGALGTLRDLSGNSFDQAALMIALLRAGGWGYADVRFHLGRIHLDRDAHSDDFDATLRRWFGIDASDWVPFAKMMIGGGIRAAAYVVNPTTGSQIQVAECPSGANCALGAVWIDHVWVQVRVDEQDFAFDPSLKNYTIQDRPDFDAAMDYSRTALVSSATRDATVTSSRVGGVDRAGVRAELARYVSNFVSQMREAGTTGSLSTALGGKSLSLPAHGLDEQLGERATTHPFGWYDDAHAEWDGVEDLLPSMYTATLRISHRSGLDVILPAQKVYGKVLSLSFESQQDPDGLCPFQVKPALYLDGVRVAEGDYVAPQTRDGYAADCFAGVPVLAEPVTLESAVPLWHKVVAEDGSSDEKWTRTKSASLVLDPSASVHGIVASWGMVGEQQSVRLQHGLAGLSMLTPDSDPMVVQGHVAAIMGYRYLAQQSSALRLMHRIAGRENTVAAFAGAVSIGDGVTVDLPLSLTSYHYQLSGRCDVPDCHVAPWEAFCDFSSALEHGVIEQTYPTTAVSTVGLLDRGMQAGDALVAVTCEGKTSGQLAEELRVAYNHGADDAARIAEAVCAVPGNVAYMAEDGGQAVGEWSGAGWVISAPGAGIRRFTISGGLSGGESTDGEIPDGEDAICLEPEPDSSGEHGKWNDPIDMVTGAYLYESPDMSVGNEQSKYRLTFNRYYNSTNSLRNGALGRGWRHNYDGRVSVTSDARQGFGADSVIDAAPAIVALHVMASLHEGGRTLLSTALSSIVAQWMMEQLTNNVVHVDIPKGGQQFVKLPDGSYNPPPGSASSLRRMCEFSSGTTIFGIPVPEVTCSWILEQPNGDLWTFNPDDRLEEIRELGGYTISLGYSDDRLTTVSNSFGRQLRLLYDGEYISSVEDDHGSGFAYDYGVLGDGEESYSDLVAVTNQHGESKSYVYDGEGRLSSGFDHDGDSTVTVFENTYDGAGRIKKQVGALGDPYFYYFAGVRSEEVDPLGNRNLRYYTPFGAAVAELDGLEAGVSESDALHRRTLKMYDDQRRLTREVAPEGDSVSYAYDARHNVVEVRRDPKPGYHRPALVVSMTYHPSFNKPATVTDARGNVTSYEYDAGGRVLSVMRPAPIPGAARPTTEYTYTPDGLLETVTDAEGRTTSHQYAPGSAEVAATTRGYGQANLVTRRWYRDNGALWMVRDPWGNDTTYSHYAPGHRVEAKHLPTGQDVRYVYDERGRLAYTYADTGYEALSPEAETVTTYTDTSKVESIRDPDGDFTFYTYDACDRLETVTNGEGDVVKYEYDAADRVVAVLSGSPARGMQVVREQVHTVNGLVDYVLDGRGNKTDYIYDGFDRLISTVYPDTSTEEVHYDDTGVVEYRVTRAGDVIDERYDALGRLESRTLPDARVYGYGYDKTGMRTSVWLTQGELLLDEVASEYDSARRPTAEWASNGRVTEYAYDDLSHSMTLTHPDGFRVTYEYDAVGRIDRIRDKDSRLFADYDYTPLSRQVRYRNGVVSILEYELDGDLGHVEHQTRGETVVFSYDSDGAGRRERAEVQGTGVWAAPVGQRDVYVPNNLNQYVSVGGSAALGYDGNGNLSYDGAFSYDYDVERRMIAASSVGMTVESEYDPVGRRRAVTAGGVRTEYAYAGSNVVAEYDAVGRVVRRFVYGPGVDSPVMMISRGRGYFLHADGGNSVVAVTDEDGDIAETYAYGPFGETATGSAVGNPYRFTGRRFDEDAGLYYYRARHYHPGMGRFMQPDPIGYGDGMNLYAYTHNDPVNFLDPTGMWTFYSGFNATGVVGETGTNAGVAYGQGWYLSVESSGVEFGRYEQTGDAAGADADVSVVAGVTWDSNDFEGESISAGVDTGPGSLNASLDPASGDIIGIEFGMGPGLGASVTETTTSTSPSVSFTWPWSSGASEPCK